MERIRSNVVSLSQTAWEYSLKCFSFREFSHRAHYATGCVIKAIAPPRWPKKRKPAGDGRCSLPSGSAGLVEDARPTAFAVRALTFAGLRSQQQRFGKLKRKAVDG